MPTTISTPSSSCATLTASTTGPVPLQAIDTAWIPLSSDGKVIPTCYASSVTHQDDGDGDDDDDDDDNIDAQNFSPMDLCHSHTQQQHQHQHQQRLIRTMEQTGWYTEEDFLYTTSTHTSSLISSPSSPSPPQGILQLQYPTKRSYPLHNLSSRQSILLTTSTAYNPSIVVVRLYDAPYTLLALHIDGCIQYVTPEQQQSKEQRIPSKPPTSPPKPKPPPSQPLYEMMTHIPMCSVTMEASYILILNATSHPNCVNDGSNKPNCMTGYGIVQQLLYYYYRTTYKIIFVEEDPILYQLYIQYFDAHHPQQQQQQQQQQQRIFQDARITVVHANPFSYMDTNHEMNRYHVIYATDDSLLQTSLLDTTNHPEQVYCPSVSIKNDNTGPSNDSDTHCRYRTNIYQALVPGGVACIYTNPITALKCSNFENNEDIPMKVEYAMVPTVSSSFICTSYNNHNAILQLCTRLQVSNIVASNNSTTPTRTNPTDSVLKVPTCTRPIRSPSSCTVHNTGTQTSGSPQLVLDWYSNETHRSAFVLPPFLQRQLSVCTVNPHDHRSTTNTDGTHDASIGSMNTESVVGREVVNESVNADMHADIRFSNGNKNRPNNVQDTTEDTIHCLHPQSFGCFGQTIHRRLQQWFPSKPRFTVLVP
jgi:hypothetical protein